MLAAEELPRDEGAERRVANLRALEACGACARHAGKTVAVFTPFLTSTTDYGRAVRAQMPHVPVLRDTERTLRVMRALADAGAGRFTPARSSRRLPRRDVARALARARGDARAADRAQRGRIESAAARLWHPAAAGTSRADRRPRPIDARADIGFPVVLKAVSAAIPHKSDAGLVLLNVRDADGGGSRVADADGAARRKLGAPLDGILVAQQITGGIEIRARRQPRRRRWDRSSCSASAASGSSCSRT